MKKTKGDITSDIVDTDLYLIIKCGDEPLNSTRRVLDGSSFHVYM